MDEHQGSALSKESMVPRPRVVLKANSQSGSQDLYLYKKQDHLGNRNKMRRAVEKPEATLLTTEYPVYGSQR